MAASFSPARLFLKTGRFGSRHQKKKSSGSSEGSSKVDKKQSAASGWIGADDKQTKQQLPAHSSTDTLQKSSSPGTMKETLGVPSSFQGLPPSLQLDSLSFMEDDELKALGITTKAAGSPHGGMRSVKFMSAEEEELDDVFEMEVPIQFGREKRPDLQVSIPKVRLPPSKSPRLMNSATTAPTPQSAISTASLKTPHIPKSGTTGTPLSIVSPLSVVEMPKPQRPFSAESIEGMAKESRAALVNSSKRAPSGNDAEGERRFMEQGRRSSNASVESDPEILIQHATEVVPQTTTLYHAALVSTPSKRLKKEYAEPQIPPVPTMPYMRRQTSSTSLATVGTINTNKPLPPEPGRSGNSPLKHIAYTSHTRQGSESRGPSRSNSTSTQRKKPQQIDKGEATSPTSIKTENVSRKNSRTSLSKVSLRSKYTPRDLDAMDDAFQRKPGMANNSNRAVLYSNQPTPSQSQVSLITDLKQLQTIAESSQRTSGANPVRPEPLQVSRGPMRMEPTRRPPQPPQAPQRVHTIAAERISGRRPPVTRAVTHNQLGMQARIEEPPQRSASTTEAVSKAERILGKTGISLSARPDMRPTWEFQWDPNESSRDYATAESSVSEGEEYEVPELDARHDAQEMEIRRRLALLSAKDDPSTVFEAFHKNNADDSTNKPYDKSVEETIAKPTIEEKLHLTGSIRNEVNMPTHIAELEAAKRTPSPAELEGSFLPLPIEEPAELGMPSPGVIVAIPVPPEPEEAAQRRGRFSSSNPHSTASGKSRSLHSQRSIKVRSLASLAASDIPDIYASLPTPPNRPMRHSTLGEDDDGMITADAAERVLLHILQSLDNLEDLFAASMVSKGFFRTFKRHELFLLKRAIWRMSPAAWELREMSIPYSELPPGSSDYTPHLYFRHYVQDLLTMVELKAMILESCKSFLRQDTISGLAGETERSSMIDDAFWRVWTFCRIFGCGNNREDDIVGQMDWLKGGALAKQSPDTRTLALIDEMARNSVLFNPPAGFARGNGKGLSSEELYDMYEIWTCLGVLVRGYQGKRQEAREYGVYDQCEVPKGDEAKENAFLDEWTHHLLTLAPSTVLDVTSPATPTRTQFAQARSQGYTSWTPPKHGASRSTFLKEAVSRVYEEILAAKRCSPQACTKSSGLPLAASPSIGAEAAIASRERIARHAAEIRKKKEDPAFKDVPVSDDRPLSNYTDVLDRLEAISTATDDAPPMPKLPGLAARLSRHKSKGNSSVTENTTVKLESPSPSLASFTPSSTAPIHSAPPPLPTIVGSPPKASIGAAKAKVVADTDMVSKDKLKTSKASVAQSSPSRQGAGRFSSLRGHITPKRMDKKNADKRSKQTAGPASPVKVPEEKLPVHPDAIPNGVVPSGPQVRDPVDLAVEKLVEMGFEEVRAKKALAQTESGNGINFDSALQKLTKDRQRKNRLERLDTMG